MSASSDQIPDVWDDNWENQADTQPTPPPEKKVSSKVTKAQRRAQQAEFNRQLWAEAESPQTFHFAETRSNVPLKQDFKPAVTVLSRKPQPQIATPEESWSSSTVDTAASGVGQFGLNNNNNNNNEDDDSDENEAGKLSEPTPEERQAIALRNLEEKQRKYEEVRERLFGSPSATTSGTSSPGSTTPPRQQQSGEGKGKGKGRGGQYREMRDSSTASNKSRQLYDRSGPAKSNQQRRDRQQGNDYIKQVPQQPSRSPRGPDASGRGGFKFSNRGGQAS